MQDEEKTTEEGQEETAGGENISEEASSEEGETPTEGGEASM